MSHHSEHPLFARIYDPVMALPERWLLEDHREQLTEGLSGRVLDVGSGTGAMFPYYGPEVSVQGIEPDPAMRRRAVATAADADSDIEVTDARAEKLPYPDSSFDAAVAVFVLCTVRDLEAAIDELARVLRPGGELRVLEHVRARGAVGYLHDALAPVWFHVAGGCHLNRRTADTLLRTPAFELLEFSRSGSDLSRLVPTVRACLERRRDGRFPVSVPATPLG